MGEDGVGGAGKKPNTDLIIECRDVCWSLHRLTGVSKEKRGLDIDSVSLCSCLAAAADFGPGKKRSAQIQATAAICGYWSSSRIGD
jgi:hypothetical protein